MELIKKAVISYYPPKALLDLYQEVSKNVDRVNFYPGHIDLKGSAKAQDKRILATLWFTLFCMSIDCVDKELLAMFFDQFDIIKKDIIK